MYEQSTASQSFFQPLSAQQTQTDKFLINTTKVIRGHKLKTRDFVKMQLLRFRKSSPVKYDEMYQPLAIEEAETITQYTKFRPYQSYDQDDMQRIVQRDRAKMSRETKGRIKLFNNNKLNTTFQVAGGKEGHFPDCGKPATGHQLRNLKKTYGGSKTITNESQKVTMETRKDKRKCAVFKSENLGSKMNDYLNLYLNHGREDEGQGGEEMLREEKRKQRGNGEERVSQTIDVFRRKTYVPYLKKMKKQARSRVDSNDYDLTWQNRSQQLVKPNTAFPNPKRERFVMKNRGN